MPERLEISPPDEDHTTEPRNNNAADQEVLDSHRESPVSGALRAQRAIIASEFYWHGGFRNSSDIHAELDGPTLGPRELEM